MMFFFLFISILYVGGIYFYQKKTHHRKISLILFFSKAGHGKAAHTHPKIQNGIDMMVLLLSNSKYKKKYIKEISELHSDVNPTAQN